MSILVTRPAPEGAQLVERLRLTGRQAWHLPLIEFLPGGELPKLSSQFSDLRSGDAIIVVSSRVLSFAGPYLQAQGIAWRNDIDYFAIGKRSALDLHFHCQRPVDFPEESLTESLLALPELERVVNKKILILRGNGGRELLGDALQERGANISYCECYQRVPMNYQGAEQALYWRQKGISTLIVTSGEMLNLLYEMVPAIDRHQWLLHCRLIVVSERLAAIASQFGWRDIIVADGADNDALLRALR